MIELAIAPPPLAGADWRGHRRIAGGGVADNTPLELTIGKTVSAPEEVVWRGKAILAEATLQSDATLLCNFVDIDPVAEEEFNAWYDSEHMPRLAALPGVRGTARYRAVEGASPVYLALYELEGMDVAEGQAWLAAARTPWTARMKRFTRNYASYIFGPL